MLDHQYVFSGDNDWLFASDGSFCFARDAKYPTNIRVKIKYSKFRVVYIKTQVVKYVLVHARSIIVIQENRRGFDA